MQEYWLPPLWAFIGITGGMTARLLAMLAAPAAEVPSDDLASDDIEGRTTSPPAGQNSGDTGALAVATVVTAAPGKGAGLLRCPACGQSVFRRGAFWPHWLPGGESNTTGDDATPPRCDGCHTAAQAFPLAELSCAAIFWALAVRFTGVTLLLYSFATVVLLALFLTDVAFRLIPNRILYPATLVLAIVAIALRGPVTPLVGAAICGGFFLAIFAFGLLMSTTVFKGRLAFGLGDVKLAFFVGLLVGGSAALTALTLTVLVGAGLALLWIVRGQHRAALPYGTALAIGAVLTLFVDPSVV